jgi:hypothetical protein
VVVIELTSKKMGSFFIFCPAFSVCPRSQVQAIVRCRQGVAAVSRALFFVRFVFFAYGHGFCLILSLTNGGVSTLPQKCLLFCWEWAALPGVRAAVLGLDPRGFALGGVPVDIEEGLSVVVND